MNIAVHCLEYIVAFCFVHCGDYIAGRVSEYYTGHIQNAYRKGKACNFTIVHIFFTTLVCAKKFLNLVCKRKTIFIQLDKPDQ